MRKYVSLFLAIVFSISSLGELTVYAQDECNSIQDGAEQVQADMDEDLDEKAIENPEDVNASEAEGTNDKDDENRNEGTSRQDKTALETEAAVNDFTLEYQEAEDVMVLKYQLNAAVSYVDILVDGRPVETDYSKVYTSYSYELPNDAEGKEYTFQVIPYELRTADGKEVEIVGTPSEEKEYEIPYKQAVFTEVDADYDLTKKYLTFEWFGSGISSVDIYLDDAQEPVVSEMPGNSYSMTMDWEPLSKHTFRMVPYNKIGEKGTEKSGEIIVDDYTAVIDLLDVQYIEKTGQIQIKWEGTNVKFVDIYMNDELLAQGYDKPEFLFHYVPQAGASYRIELCPYNENGIEGEEETDTLLEGDFQIPDIDKLEEASSYGTDSDKHYTGFSKPAVNIQWTAQANASYEIYRGARDGRSAYSCIARVKADKNGPFLYKDNNAGIGSNFYKLRQIITEDDYMEQEVSTAMSASEEIVVSVPKPKVHVNLTEEGAVVFDMDGKKEFISGYIISRKNKSGSYKKIAEVTDNTYIDNNTEFGKKYSYKVKSFYYDTKAKKRHYSPAASVKARNTVGSFTVKAQQTEEQTVKLTWEPAANAEGYEVYYKSATQGDSYKLLKETNKLKLNVYLRNGIKYCFMVKAYKGIGDEKTYFSTAETELKTGFTKPGNFRIVKTDFNYDAAKKILVRNDKLAWDKVYGAKGYYLEIYQPLKKKFQVVKKIKGSSNTSFVVSNSLPAATESLIYRVRSYSDTKKASSENLELKVQIGKVDGVRVSKAGGSARVSWNASEGAELYRIYRSNGRNCTLVGTTDQLKCTDKGLSAGVVYSYYVQAVSNTLKSEGCYSNPVKYMRKIAKVEDLSASHSDNQSVELEWSSEEGACGHIIYCREGSGEYKVLARVSRNRTNYTHRKLTGGKTYYYKVTRLERNAGGVEAESAVEKVKIKIKKTQKQIRQEKKQKKNNNKK